MGDVGFRPNNLPAEYLFLAKTVQASCVRQLCDVLDKILRDTNLLVTADGLKIASMDTSKVCLVHLKLLSDKFESYQCEKGQSLGVNMQDLSKLLKSATHNDTVMLYVLKESDEFMWIQIDNSEKHHSVKNFIRLLDINEKVCGFKEVDFSYIITLPSAQLQRICREQHALAKEVTIISKPNELIFKCEGDRAGQTVVIGQTCNGSVTGMSMPKMPENFDEESTVTATYSLKYLLNFSKATALYSTVEIFIAEGYPLVLKYAVGTLGELKLALTALEEDD